MLFKYQFKVCNVSHVPRLSVWYKDNDLHIYLDLFLFSAEIKTRYLLTIIACQRQLSIVADTVVIKSHQMMCQAQIKPYSTVAIAECHSDI